MNRATDPIEELFAVVAAIAEYPKGMKEIPNRIKGLAFFPGGDGLWVEDNIKARMPVGKIMILGQDFDSEANYDKSLAKGAESKEGATWRNLLLLLEECGIHFQDCFFTNAYMGIRCGDKATGPSPAIKDKQFVDRCHQLFLKQVAALKPKVILVLGKQVADFLYPLSDDLKVWCGTKTIREIDEMNAQVMRGVRFTGYTELCSHVVLLTHPCWRGANAKRRTFKTYTGNAAEIEMIKVAVDL